MIANGIDIRYLHIDLDGKIDQGAAYTVSDIQGSALSLAWSVADQTFAMVYGTAVPGQPPETKLHALI